VGRLGRVVHPHPSGWRKLALQEGMAWTGPRPVGHSPNSNSDRAGAPRRGTRSVLGRAWMGDLREPGEPGRALETVKATGPTELVVRQEQAFVRRVGPPT
jgi:hypothetical protein